MFLYNDPNHNGLSRFLASYMTPADYCLQRIGGRVSNLACSLMFLPRRARADLTALYAFIQEISDVPAKSQEPAVVLNKLQWWQEEIRNTFQGNGRHPVSQALQPLVQAGKLGEQDLHSLIEAYANEIAPVRFPSFQALQDHAYRTGGAAQLLCLDSLDMHQTELRSLGRQLGAAHRLAALLQQTGADVRGNRLFIPEEDLHQFQVSESEILAYREPPAFQRLMDFQAGRILGLPVHNLGTPPDHPALLPGLILAALDRALLTEIRADGYHVLSRRIVLTPLRHLWTAWRTRRLTRRRRLFSMGQTG